MATGNAWGKKKLYSKKEMNKSVTIRVGSIHLLDVVT